MGEQAKEQITWCAIACEYWLGVAESDRQEGEVQEAIWPALLHVRAYAHQAHEIARGGA
jgi:hypothetical protein